MASLVQQSTTQLALKFLLVQSSDHITGLTGATPTVTIRKEGGSFASPAGTVTEIANGWYQVAGNATDTNTLGEILLHATATSGDPTDIVAALVVGFNPQAALATPTNITAITGNITGNLSGSVGSVTGGVTVTTNNDKTGYSLTQAFPANFAATLITAGGLVAPDFTQANGIETGLTIQQALRLIASTTGAKLSGAGTGTETFRNAVADTTNRVVATVDSSGNRTAITYSL